MAAKFMVSMCMLALVCPALAGRALSDQISEIAKDTDKILETFKPQGPSYHQTYNRLAEFTDTIGNRISGSAALSSAVEYMLTALKADGLENVHGEEVQVPHWVRGKETLTMTRPRQAPLALLGLGGSVGTGGKPLRGEVLVVQSYDELANRTAEAKGKIVMYNPQCDWAAMPIACYDMTVTYRSSGAIHAAEAGAIASLVRTIGAYSIDSPHTGHMSYSNSVPKIPHAAIAIEDAEGMQRMADRGQTIEVELSMEAQILPDTTSHNVVAEWTGSEFPNETVIVSGHLDSWDVGVGAMDDGGGAFASWQVLTAMKNAGVRPRRTVRLVMWTCEEFGGVGSAQYFKAHQDEVPTMSIAMESDLGVFGAKGIQFSGSREATTVMESVVTLLNPIHAGHLMPNGTETDTGPWSAAGVPTATLANYNDRYFWFHHSNGDQMTVFDPNEVDEAAMALAVTAFSVASLDEKLPR